MSLRDIVDNDPQSSHYVLPPGDNAKDCVKLMLAQQKKMFGSTILEAGELTYLIILRNMGLLIKEYSLDDVKRGIMIASIMADHPFSTAFVKGQIECRLAYQNCPVLTSINSRKP